MKKYQVYIILLLQLIGIGFAIYSFKFNLFLAIFLLAYFIADAVVSCLKIYLKYQEKKMLKEVIKMGGDQKDFKKFMDNFLGEIEFNQSVVEAKKKNNG